MFNDSHNSPITGKYQPNTNKALLKPSANTTSNAFYYIVMTTVLSTFPILVLRKYFFKAAKLKSCIPLKKEYILEPEAASLFPAEG